MRCLLIKMSILLTVMPAVAIAGWQVETSQTIATAPSFKAGTQQSKLVSTALDKTKANEPETKRYVALPAEPFFQTGKQTNKTFVAPGSKTLPGVIIAHGQYEQQSLSNPIESAESADSSSPPLTDDPQKTAFHVTTRSIETSPVDHSSYQPTVATASHTVDKMPVDKVPAEKVQTSPSPLQTYADTKRNRNVADLFTNKTIQTTQTTITVDAPQSPIPPPVYSISVSGSLKENIERIMRGYHWKVVWIAPYDYNFDGRVTGSSLSNAIEKLLRPFPLQAVMYVSNRIMTIVPRKV